MSSPSLSRTSSFASLSSIFSDPADYVIVPRSADRLRDTLLSLDLVEDEKGTWKKIANELANLLCDLHYRLTIAAWMNVYSAVHDICLVAKLSSPWYRRRGPACNTSIAHAGASPNPSNEVLRENLDGFLSAYLDGIREIADELGPAERNEFLRERRERYLQAAQYASHAFAYHDRHYTALENSQRWKGSMLDIEALFYVLWYRSKLPTFDRYEPKKGLAAGSAQD